MRTCMVIQPFDSGEFDKRYKEVLTPAIERAGMRAYRVDNDPSTRVVIDQIEKAIRDADACLADISMPNPNVWYEIGYAFAARKDVVMVCKSGVVLPFDIRHQAIIFYSLESTSDFKLLREKITQKLQAFDKLEKAIEGITQVKPTQGLTPHETVALVLLMEYSLSSNQGVTGGGVADAMRKAGFTKAATAIALEGLVRMQLAWKTQEEYSDFNRESCDCYGISRQGVQWCLDNQGRLNLRYEKPSIDQGDDDIPF